MTATLTMLAYDWDDCDNDEFECRQLCTERSRRGPRDQLGGGAGRSSSSEGAKQQQQQQQQV